MVFYYLINNIIYMNLILYIHKNKDILIDSNILQLSILNGSFDDPTNYYHGALSSYKQFPYFNMFVYII